MGVSLTATDHQPVTDKWSGTMVRHLVRWSNAVSETAPVAQGFVIM